MSGLGDRRQCPATHKPEGFAIAVSCERGPMHRGDHKAHCDDCNGVGYLHGRPSAKCHTCDGEGEISW